MTEAELRRLLVSKVQRLTADRLPALARWFDALECDGLPPLSNTAGTEVKLGSSPGVEPVQLQHISKSGGEPSHSKDWPDARRSIASDRTERISSPPAPITRNTTFAVASGLIFWRQTCFASPRSSAGSWKPGRSFPITTISSRRQRPTGDRCAALTALHSLTAREVNRLDANPGRKVWHNYWDTELTYEKPIWCALTTSTRTRSNTGSFPLRTSIRGAPPPGSSAWRPRRK